MTLPLPAFTTAHVLITGAASGIGRACAEALHEAGAAMILIDRDGGALDAVLAGEERVSRHVGDVADERFWDGLSVTLAPLTHALINAGVAGSGSINSLSLAEWRRVMTVNLDGAFLTLRAAMRAMIARHAVDGRGGAIVTTASVSGIKAEPGTAAYSASKAALIQLTKVAAKEGAAHKIRVNAVAPGGVDTPIWDSMDGFAEMVAAQGGDRDAVIASMAAIGVPLGSYARPEEIAAQVAFLMGEGAAHMTGAVLVADGGYSL
jgi:NAD(P)-dependent dehydrogenase (short-subunit alcohol dehydrogenase family)